MAQHPLADVPANIDQICGDICRLLRDRYGANPQAGLTEDGFLTERTAVFFTKSRLPAQLVLPRIVQLALMSDCLTVIALACLNAPREIDWNRLEGMRPLLSRLCVFLAGALPNYASFRDLTKERLTDLVNQFATDQESFGLQCEDTRFLGRRLCSHIGEDLKRRFVAHVLEPLWRFVPPRVGVVPETAAMLWRAVVARS